MTLPRKLRITLIAVTAVIAVAAAAGVIGRARFDRDGLKPRIIEAVKRATGRTLSLNGKIGLKASLTPTVRVEDVAFANPDGFSRPQMATVREIELQLRLLPLLSGRIEIDRLVLIHPDILLETDKDGQANWRFTPEASPASSQASAERGPKTKTAIGLDSIRIQDGTVAYRDEITGQVTTIGLPKLEAAAATPDSPLHIDADATYNGTAFSLTGDTGSLNRLRDHAATTPWPVKLAVTAGAAKLTADGTLTNPLRAKGYNLAVSLTVLDAAALTPLLQGTVLPSLRDVSFTANVADTGGKLPEFSTLTLHVGASDLSARVLGLTLEKLDIDAPKVDQPMRFDATARLGDTKLTVTGTAGPPALLRPDATPAPFPVDATIQAGGATASAKGSIADVRALTGLNIALAAQIPDLSELSSLAGRPLPALKTMTFQANLTDAGGGFRHGAALHGFALTSPDADLSGDAAIDLGGSRPSLTATVKSSRIDLDALQAATGATPAQAIQATPPSTPAAQTPKPKRRDEPLFSTEPIPFDLLRLADADLTLEIAALHTEGTDAKAVTTRAVLANGNLTVDPFAADLPGGHLSGTLSIDAKVHLGLHAPGLPLKPILAAAHQPGYASGNLEVYADLTATGDTPHALAASLDGSLGLAIPGGTIDNRLVGVVLGKVMNTLDALNLTAKGGTSALKCFALHMDARHGVAAINPVALSSSLLTMTGAGTVNLGAETVAMSLRPRARLAGTTLVVPIAVSGPIREPAVKVNDLGAAEANAGTVAGALLGDATPLGIAGGLLGADKLFGGTNDICPPALAAARGQPIPDAKPEKPSAANPGAFLKNLFR